MRAAAAEDDGAHLIRPLEERPAPPAALTHRFAPATTSRASEGHAVHPVRGATVAPAVEATAERRTSCPHPWTPVVRKRGHQATRRRDRRNAGGPHDARGDRPMSMTSTDAATGSRDIKSHEKTSFADLGKEMWAYLTGKGAAINYEFVDMVVEVPRETGTDAPRAVWRL